MLCSFKTKGECNTDTCSPSYARDMIRSQLIAGLRNQSHQSRVLSEISNLTSLEQLTTRLLALEITDRASTQFRSPFESVITSDVAPVKSNQRPKSRADNKKSCSGCVVEGLLAQLGKRLVTNVKSLIILPLFAGDLPYLV